MKKYLYQLNWSMSHKFHRKKGSGDYNIIIILRHNRLRLRIKEHVSVSRRYSKKETLRFATEKIYDTLEDVAMSGIVGPPIVEDSLGCLTYLPAWHDTKQKWYYQDENGNLIFEEDYPREEVSWKSMSLNHPEWESMPSKIYDLKNYEPGE